MTEQNPSAGQPLPKNKEALEYLMKASDMRSDLQSAIGVLYEARSPFVAGSDQEKEWLKQKSELIAGVNFDHFGGPEPEGEDFPY